MFIDLDCRFDVLRLLQLLKCRISCANGSNTEHKEEMSTMRKEYNDVYDEDLIEVCLKRFRYIRCYDSFEFLATLKGLTVELQTSRTKLCSSVSFLMIDSIGAYYWVDRASTSLPFGSSSRRTFSLQSVSETVVNEIRNVLLLHPMLVLTTKAAIFSDKGATHDAKSSRKRYTSETLHETTMRSGSENSLYQEYMPSVWQMLLLRSRSL